MKTLLMRWLQLPKSRWVWLAFLAIGIVFVASWRPTAHLEPDERPFVGTWNLIRDSDGFNFVMTFHADRTLQLKQPDGTRYNGLWSVDERGRLQLAVESTTKAWTFRYAVAGWLHGRGVESRTDRHDFDLVQKSTERIELKEIGSSEAYNLTLIQ